VEVPSLTDSVIVLDALTDADAEVYVTLEDVIKRRTWRQAEPRTVEGARVLIAEYAQHWATDARLRAFAIRTAEHRTLIGQVTVKVQDAEAVLEVVTGLHTGNATSDSEPFDWQVTTPSLFRA
jgi:hypothetical protein